MEKTFLRPRETRTDAQTILKLNDLAPIGGQSATPQCNFKFEAVVTAQTVRISRMHAPVSEKRCSKAKDEADSRYAKSQVTR